MSQDSFSDTLRSFQQRSAPQPSFFSTFTSGSNPSRLSTGASDAEAQQGLLGSFSQRTRDAWTSLGLTSNAEELDCLGLSRFQVCQVDGFCCPWFPCSHLTCAFLSDTLHSSACSWLRPFASWWQVYSSSSTKSTLSYLMINDRLNDNTLGLLLTAVFNHLSGKVRSCVHCWVRYRLHSCLGLNHCLTIRCYCRSLLLILA